MWERPVYNTKKSVYTAYKGTSPVILFASYDREEAERFGDTVKSEIIDVLHSYRELERVRLDKLELYALENAFKFPGETQVCCIVKQGTIDHVFPPRLARSMQRKHEKRDVNLMDIARAAIDRLNPVERLILNEMYTLSSYRKSAISDDELRDMHGGCEALALDRWKQEVVNDDTVLGYQEWVAHKLDASAADADPSVCGLAPR